ncbi:hypothetical protein GE061_001810 [Apolygus lucorum]|uniref:CCDC92/74 N-terminal domain-containing protein n=1 Tax=Apolygus lucorum TaxID=248454 RepID=A0A8S9X4S3_APOLU|nr:hypothetical protein GE061_001810 [Apolygus lucorum]
MKSVNMGVSVQNPNRCVLPPLPSSYSRENSPRLSPIDNRLIDLPTPRTTRLNSIGKKAVEPLRPEPFLMSCISSDPLLRVTQLEQNLNFLQDQHQMMLASLHQEIEALRSRNRDLQFQLIFGGNNKTIPSSSDSSPGEGTQPKIVLSPKEINSRSLQVEMLEREVSELKVTLSEANSKNAHLLQLVDHQKKQLDSARKDPQEPDLTDRLEDAENLIKRLVKENEDQRKEINNLRGQLGRGGHSGRYSGHRRGGNDHQRFPPLQSHNFWGGGSHQNQKHKSNPDFHSNHGQMDHEVVGQAAPSLPHLNRTYSQPSSTRHRYYNRGNSHEEGEGRRRYRGRGSASHHKEDIGQ